jgi:hypothetical protein
MLNWADGWCHFTNELWKSLPELKGMFLRKGVSGTEEALGGTFGKASWKCI